ncbi:MAG: RNA polymerase sigma factor [Myxococcota bacterium]
MTAPDRHAHPVDVSHGALLRDLPRAARRHCPTALRHVGEDICQSAAAQVLARAQRNPETIVTSAYVRRAARNAAIDVVRKESRRREWWLLHHAQFPTPMPQDPERQLMERQLRHTVATHLHALPDARREVVLLYIEGHGIAEIAQRIGCNRKRADNLVRRGLATLRQALLNEGVMAA